MAYTSLSYSFPEELKGHVFDLNVPPTDRGTWWATVQEAERARLSTTRHSTTESL